MFPYLRFLGECEWDDFRSKIDGLQTNRPTLAAKRTQAYLRRVMLRRTKDTELNGIKILQLPAKTVDLVELEFTPEERAIYKAIELKARVRVNKYLKEGTVLKHYHVILVLLLRLRQLCCHPWLLRHKDGSPITDTDLTVTDDDIFGDIDQPRVDDLSETARAETIMGKTWVKHSRRG